MRKLDNISSLLFACVTSSITYNKIAFGYEIYAHYFNCINNKEAMLIFFILSDICDSKDYKKNKIKELLGTDTIDQKYYSYDYYGSLAEKYDIQVGFSKELIELVKNCLYSVQQDNNLDAKYII